MIVARIGSVVHACTDGDPRSQTLRRAAYTIPHNGGGEGQTLTSGLSWPVYASFAVCMICLRAKWMWPRLCGLTIGERLQMGVEVRKLPPPSCAFGVRKHSRQKELSASRKLGKPAVPSQTFASAFWGSQAFAITFPPTFKLTTTSVSPSTVCGDNQFRSDRHSTVTWPRSSHTCHDSSLGRAGSAVMAVHTRAWPMHNTCSLGPPARLPPGVHPVPLQVKRFNFLQVFRQRVCFRFSCRACTVAACRDRAALVGRDS